MEDTLFVSDLLYELSRGFVQEMTAVIEQASSFPGDKKKKMSDLWKALGGKEDVLLSSVLSTLLEGHVEVCNALAKGLAIYNTLYVPPSSSSSQPEETSVGQREVLSTFSHLLGDYVALRKEIAQVGFVSPGLHEYLASQHLETRDWQDRMHDGLAAQAQKLDAWMHSVDGERPREEVAGKRPEDGNKKTAKEESKATPGSSTWVDRIQSDWLVAERVGIFLPAVHLPGIDSSSPWWAALPPFSACQLCVEVSLLALGEKVRAYNEARKHLYANSSALQAVQQEIHRSLWSPSRKSHLEESLSRDKQPASSSSPALASHLIDTMSAFNHQQRVDQVAQYLEVLNQRAIAKKKVLQTLMNLWAATKELMQRPSLTSPSKKQPTITRQEILHQTQTLQDRLLRDMQSAPPVKTQQVG